MVRSAVFGSSIVEIWSGIATSIRFSSLPDRKDIGEITFPTGFFRLAPGGEEPSNCRIHQKLLRRSFANSHTFSQAWELACISGASPFFAVYSRIRHDRLAP